MTTYLGTLDISTPKGSGTEGQRSNGDAEISGLKAAWVNTFPNVAGEVTVTHTELSYEKGMVSPVAAAFGIEQDVGGDDDYVATISGIDAYADGLEVTIQIGFAMTSGTLNINGLGAIDIVDMFGDAIAMPVGAVLNMIYDNGQFKLLSNDV